MFTGFDLRVNKDNDILGDRNNFDKLMQVGKHHLDDQKARYSEELKEYITKNNIDGTRVQDEWFPQIDADIFISHSHDDEDLACALAGWIHETFGLRCFLDSNVWGYSKELLEIMNAKLSNKRENKDGGYLYDHQSCNNVSQHVNAMLSIALQKMIDKTEAVILVNTENSVQVCTENHMNQTYSPWIYTEIACTQIVRKKPLLAYRDYKMNLKRENVLFESVRSAIQFTISYTVSLDHLKSLEEEDLEKWEEEYCENKEDYEYPLDALYQLKCAADLNKTRRLFEILSEQELGILKGAYSARNSNPEKWEDAERVWERIMHRGMECFQGRCDKCEQCFVGVRKMTNDG